MLYRPIAAAALLTMTLTACPAAEGDAAPVEVSSYLPSTPSAGAAAPEPAACPEPAPAPACPAAPEPAACPQVPACPAAPEPAACPAPEPAPACPEAPACPAPPAPSCPDYPAQPTTYSLAQPWPLPADHPHAHRGFCLATIDGTAVTLGCGDVNHPTLGHLNVRYTQRRMAMDTTTGQLSIVSTERTCYGPHGPDYTDVCVPDTACKIDYRYGDNGTYKSMWGKCVLAP